MVCILVPGMDIIHAQAWSPTHCSLQHIAKKVLQSFCCMTSEFQNNVVAMLQMIAMQAKQMLPTFSLVIKVFFFTKRLQVFPPFLLTGICFHLCCTKNQRSNEEKVTLFASTISLTERCCNILIATFWCNMALLRNIATSLQCHWDQACSCQLHKNCACGWKQGRSHKWFHHKALWKENWSRLFDCKPVVTEVQLMGQLATPAVGRRTDHDHVNKPTIICSCSICLLHHFMHCLPPTKQPNNFNFCDCIGVVKVNEQL